MANKVIKAERTNIPETKKETPVSLEAQARLVEIMNDSPRLVSLAGTEWEIRALRMGTQWLIAQKCVDIAIKEESCFGDIIKEFAKNMPNVIDVLTLALLNDKDRIYKDGKQANGYSEEYDIVYDILMWKCDSSQFAMLLVEILQMLDVNFFMESHRILEMIREVTMARKMQTLGQK